MAVKKPSQRRSIQWFGRQDNYGFIYRSWVKNRGVPNDQFDGRPVIGICNTWSELTPCNAHFRTLAEHVKRGVLRGRRIPARVPGDVARRDDDASHSDALPQSRVSMDVEESIRANPLDGVVLLTGCDKTTPSLLMGAASVDMPTIVRVRRADAARQFRGSESAPERTSCRCSEQLRAGQITLEEFHEAEAGMHRSHGHCMTMGTASTMACMVEALGVGLPGNAAIPAVDARRNLLAREAGRRIVEMVQRGHHAVADTHPRGVRERDPRQRRHRRIDERGRCT